MILSAKKVLELNKKYNLIENLSERELNNPEGVGIDVRAGEIYRLKGESFLGVSDRKTADIEKIADIKKDKFFVLKPGEFVLVKTIEKVNLPGEKIVVEEGKEPAILMQDAYPRSTLQRCGVIFRATKTDPGYSGELTFSLFNASAFPFKLELGARFANLVFSTVLGDLARPYDGQWKGGRVGAKEKERQN
jgi:deoxycytidine triphosphate deaminase